MTDRKKLIGLLSATSCHGPGESLGSCPDRKYGMCGEVADLSYCVIQNLANHLIQNGVTIQKWIPASEPPKEWRDEDGTAINFLIFTPDIGIDIGNWIEPMHTWFCLGVPFNVTHWMPLPEAPKEDGK